ncbi:MAG: DEAD/DEAH box helicase family protein, partial [Chitinispirillaceae bacterium]|nr:DEAD/DEAH box helicase family protein [Chitinispirillaceae bacterium]
EIILNFPQEKPLPRLANRDEREPVDRTRLDRIFGDHGDLAARLTAFSPRVPQLQMARGVADALNTDSIYIAEAGTGTGKSLAYLVPAALWALANETRVVVSTRTRNLQDQLTANDLPVVKSVCGDTLRFSVLKGRNNYLCLRRFEQLLRGSVGNLSPRERFAILPLIVWSASTATGDIEEQNQFNPKWFSKIWSIISADHHECAHRRCPFFGGCFLQKARAKALSSHIVIINHALFFSDICSDTPFLGTAGPIIFDEAHHLESSGHRFLRVELDTSRINLFAETVNNLVQRIGTMKEEERLYNGGRELRNSLKQFRKSAGQFLDALIAWAKDRGGQSPDFQLPCSDAGFADLPQTGGLLLSISNLGDRLLLIKQVIKDHKEPEKFESIEAQVQACSEQTSQLKADLTYLSAAQTDDHVFWTEGNLTKGWAKLCGVPLDIGALLGELWDRCNGAVIFTSATLSIASSFDYFKRTTGLLIHDARTATDLFKSPFGAHQTIAGAVKTAPAPDTPRFPAYIADTIAALHATLSKNMLVLFTANSMLTSVYQLLRTHQSVNKSNLLAQGHSGSRQIIIEEFKKNDRMVLLGTDSFWEGIDVPGDACEIVVIPRLPFPVPTHPLTQAIALRMQELEGESFLSYSVPEAVIRFRQGAGRLIRSTSDRGALIILDNRIVSRGYGKQFSRSIDVTFNTFDDTENMINALSTFFSEVTTDGRQEETGLTYVPLEDA